MLFAADIRNDGVTIGLGSREGWLRILHLGIGRTADEYEFFLGSALAVMQPLTKHRVIVSSVVPGMTEVVSTALEAVAGVSPLIVGPGLKTGVKIRTEFPSEVGSDLVCMAAGALALKKVPCIIIDCRAMLTVSYVNTSGEFLGTAIFPGPDSSVQSMRAHAAQLPEIRMAKPKSPIGKNTMQAMQSGIHWGYKGAIHALCDAFRAETFAHEHDRSEVALLATGMPRYKPLFPEGSDFITTLALDGLAAIAQLNADSLMC